MNAVATGIYTAIDAIAGSTGTFHRLAFQGAVPPYVVFLVVTQETNGSNTTDDEDVVFDARAISTASAEEAGTLAALIDVALFDKTVTVAGYTVVGLCHRVRRIPTIFDGEAWNAGATYEFRISKAR